MSEKRETLLGLPVVEVQAAEVTAPIQLATIDEVYGPAALAFPNGASGEITFGFSFDPGPAFPYHAAKLPVFEVVDETTGKRLGRIETTQMERVETAEGDRVNILGVFHRE